MATCPCCTQTMMRHIRHHHIYWFCRSCWQEMPVFEADPAQQIIVARATAPHSIHTLIAQSSDLLVPL
jgi:ribosomal protein L37AE/L43A